MSEEESDYDCKEEEYDEEKESEEYDEEKESKEEIKLFLIRFFMKSIYNIFCFTNNII